jgi:glycosyltransferase involved in cell wall biosynthesis
VNFTRRFFFSLYDGYVVPNDSSKRYILDLTNNVEKPFLLLPNIIYKNKSFHFDFFEVKKSRIQTFSSPIFLFVAQLNQRKGFDILLDAFLILCRDFPNCKLWIVGDGPLKEHGLNFIERNEIENNVKFFGHCEMDEVYKIYTRSHFFVLPTKRDPNPLTIIEALSFGLPILTTVFAGNSSDAVISGVNGIVVDIVEPNELLKQLLFFSNMDSDTYNSFSDNSYKKYNEKFETNAVIETFRDSLLNV